VSAAPADSVACLQRWAGVCRVAVLFALAAGWALPALAAEPAPPKVFIIGGSTAATFPPERPVRGWGQWLPIFFTDPAIVDNRARSGRSSKSFIDQGHWDGVIRDLRAGDTLIMCFGTNDSANDPARYTEPRGAFRDNLRRFIRETRAKQGIPVLATSVARRNWNEQGEFVEPPSEWVTVTREVARAEKVPLLELRGRTVELERSLGPEGSRLLHLYLPPGKYAAYPQGAKDDTHHGDYGAARIAELVADEIRRIDLPLARWLKPRTDVKLPPPVDELALPGQK
jgi:lysophospholipase L1-like esterase